MKTIAPTLFALFFFVLFIFEAFQCLSLSNDLTMLNRANDNLMAADQRLQDASKKLMAECGK